MLQFILGFCCLTLSVSWMTLLLCPARVFLFCHDRFVDLDRCSHAGSLRHYQKYEIPYIRQEVTDLQAFHHSKLMLLGINNEAYRIFIP